MRWGEKGERKEWCYYNSSLLLTITVIVRRVFGVVRRNGRGEKGRKGDGRKKAEEGNKCL